MFSDLVLLPCVYTYLYLEEYFIIGITDRLSDRVRTITLLLTRQISLNFLLIINSFI